MAKQGQRAEVNTFIQGLITEASPLNFPPNASKEEENFELFRDGTRKRRLGMDFESGYQQIAMPSHSIFPPPIPKSNKFIWKSPGNVPNLNFLVVQTGENIDLFDLADDALSPNIITSFTLFEGNVEASFANVEGELVVATGGSDPYLITFNGFDESPAFNFNKITLKVRDFWGVDTGDGNFETDRYYRPTTRNGYMVYNWCNQSWGIPRRTAGGVFLNPIQLYTTEYTKYPSNSEIVWTALQFQPVAPTQTPYEALYSNLWREVFGIAPIAAKGFFIIDALNRGNSRLTEYQRMYNDNNNIPYPPSELVGFKTDITPGGPSVVTSYAGRAWYAGFPGTVQDGDSRSPVLSNYVFFSQLVRNKLDVSKCYQEGDPTSREGSDIVDTDGGFVKVQGLGRVKNLQVIGNDLLILADNGVWAITGGSDYGFTATNYKITKLSDYGCHSSNSTVLEGDRVYYWGRGGIYIIAKDQFGSLGINNITKTTIQTFFNEIPTESLGDVKAIYDDKLKTARWLYKEGTMFSNTSKTIEMVLNTDLGVFSINTIKQSSDLKLEVVDMVYFEGKTKYITYTNTGTTFDTYTFSEYKDVDFLDWKTRDGIGVDAKAFVLTGAQIAGDSAVFKQAPYLVVHMTRTETSTDDNAIPQNQSSCLFNVRWDWANNETSNKITQLQQAYRYRKPFIVGPNTSMDTGFDVVTTRNKVRGRGRSIALYMETEPGKDCRILGWNITLNGNSIA